MSLLRLLFAELTSFETVIVVKECYRTISLPIIPHLHHETDSINKRCVVVILTTDKAIVFSLGMGR